MRVFLDTNVLVAAFATRGLCEDVFRVVLTEHELVISETVLEELERILAEKLRMPMSRVGALAAFLRNQGMVAHPTESAPWPASDPKDQWVVAAAIKGEAEVLVTGDKDLLEIVEKTPIPIVTPRGFWERMRYR